MVEFTQTAGGAGPVRVLFLAEHGQHHRHLKGQLDAAKGLSADFATDEPGRFGRVIAKRRALDAVIVEVPSVSPDTLELIRDIAGAAQGQGARLVIAAAHLYQADMVAMLRAGASDFLTLPYALEEIASIVDALKSTQRGPTTDGQSAGAVLTFSHAGGGAGASTLAVNAAVTLQRLDKDKRVCLIDLDLQYGSVGSLLDLNAHSPVLDIVGEPGRLDPDMLDALMLEHPLGLRVLTAPECAIPLDAVDAETVDSILALASHMFDVVVVDLPCALTNWTASVFEASDEVFAVTQLDVPAVHRLQRMMQALAVDGIHDVAMTLVANRTTRRGAMADGPSVRQVEKALGRPISHFIPNEYQALTASSNQGAPICAKSGGKYAEAVEKMVQRWAPGGGGHDAQNALARMFGGRR